MQDWLTKHGLGTLAWTFSLQGIFSGRVECPTMRNRDVLLPYQTQSGNGGERTMFHRRIHAQHLQTSKWNKTQHGPSPQQEISFWDTSETGLFFRIVKINLLILWNSSKPWHSQGPFIGGQWHYLHLPFSSSVVVSKNQQLSTHFGHEKKKKNNTLINTVKKKG